MKRQRAKSTVKNQQVKISKFFHVATPRTDLMNNVVTEENTGKLSKPMKVKHFFFKGCYVHTFITKIMFPIDIG